MPPRLPSATAAGFLPVSASIFLNRRWASRIGSVLERLGIDQFYPRCERRQAKRKREFKLTHCLPGRHAIAAARFISVRDSSLPVDPETPRFVRGRSPGEGERDPRNDDTRWRVVGTATYGATLQPPAATRTLYRKPGDDLAARAHGANPLLRLCRLTRASQTKQTQVDLWTLGICLSPRRGCESKKEEPAVV